MSRVDLSNGPLAGLPPELQTKLLKKIAQLTKVIYTLHTKSEDHDQIAEALRVKYQEDLTKSSQEYEARVDQFHSKYLREIEGYRGQLTEANSKIKDLKECFKNVEEKSATQKSYYAKELVALEQKYQLEFDKLVESVTDRNTHLADLRGVEEQNRERVKLLEEAHQVEIERIVSKFGEENKVFQNEIISLTADHSSLVRERDSLVISHKEDTKRLAAMQERALLQAREEAQGTVDDLLGHMREEFVKERQLMQTEITAMIDKVVSMDQKNQSLDLLTDQLQMKLNTVCTHCEEVESAADNLREEKSSLERELAALENKLELVANRETEGSGRIGELETTVSALESTVSALQSERDALFTSLSEAREEREKHASSSKQNDKTIASLMRSLEQECGKLRQQAVVQNEELKQEREKFKSTLEQQKLLLESERQRREEEMEEEHRNAMKNAEQNTQAALIQLHHDLTATHQFEVEKLSSEKEESIRELEVSVEALVGAVSGKSRELEDLALRLKERESGAVNAAEQVGTLQTKLKQLSAELKGKSETEIQLTKEKRALEDMCEEIEVHARKREQELVATTRKGINSSLLELNQKWEERNKEELKSLEVNLNKSHTTEITRSKHESEERLRLELEKQNCEWGEKERRHGQELTRLERELEGTQQERQQLQAVVGEKERMLSRERKEREQNHSISREEAERMQEQQQRELEAVKQAMGMRAATEMSDLRSQCEKELTAVRSGHNASVNALKDTLNRDKLGVLREIESRHRAELEGVKTKNAQSAEEAQRASREEAQRELSQMEAEFQRALEEKETHLSQLRREREAMSNQLRTQDSSKSEYKEDISRLHNAIRDMGVSLEQKENELLAIRRESSHQLKQRDLDNRTVHQKDIKSLEEKYQIRAKQLAGDFTLIRRGLEGKIEELNEELEKTDKRYFSREPRSEDLILISELQRNLNQRETELEKMREEMKFYKLELINREQSYNKMFGTKPKIGPVTPGGQTRSKSTEGGVSRNSYPSAPTLSMQRSRVAAATREGGTAKNIAAEQKVKTLTSQARN